MVLCLLAGRSTLGLDRNLDFLFFFFCAVSNPLSFEKYTGENNPPLDGMATTPPLILFARKHSINLFLQKSRDNLPKKNSSTIFHISSPVILAHENWLPLAAS
jgi:hypothetical protein